MKLAPRRLISRLRAMHMRWRDLAFFHWPIDAEPLRQRLPPVSGPPLVHFAKELDVWGHLPEKL